ncbi:L-glutamine synthetase [Asanoa ferruginea]|uniref:L-glutamine synthetase n=1 Tax=Asanoa ferruginea TaxID=53367 RepID=A0A3D9ZQ23_9ACTN|nr:glutamine synthetase family protein [Asanoa ferruginea]REF99277.1 L-glutamine synthetase [Asanoa ferruginea]GIF45876.1 glutamine synthetase [Asanoa ferruginea]
MDASERDRRAADARLAADRLAAEGVEGVALTWVDTSGITRVKAVPLARLPHAAAWGAGAAAVFDAFLVDDGSVRGRYAGGPVGDLRLHPDLSRLVPLAATPGWAWAPGDRFDQAGEPHPLDARWLLRRELDRLGGLTVRAGFEVEWCVSRGPGDEFVPATTGPAYGMIRLVELAPYLRAVLAALAAQGVVVEQIHPEYAAGQFEVAVAPDDPLGAADTVVLVQETVRAVSVAHGLRATFAPKVVAGQVGNGRHVHLSVLRDGVSAMAGGTGPFGLDRDGEAFAAGILARLPALLAIGAPSVASYLRLVPSQWAGAYACWGLENREAALRLVASESANIEVKCVDAAANPYLLLAGLLAAGRAGVVAGARLPEPVPDDPEALTPGERAARGIVRLPPSLSAAVAEFEADEVLAEALGPAVVDTVTAVRRGEIALFDGAGDEAVVAATRWRY